MLLALNSLNEDILTLVTVFANVSCRIYPGSPFAVRYYIGDLNGNLTSFIVEAPSFVPFHQWFEILFPVIVELLMHVGCCLEEAKMPAV